MIFRSLMAKCTENILNVFLYCHTPALEIIHQRLSGKVLSILIQELSTPISLMFDEKLLKILWKWQSHSDCFIMTNFSFLLKLRNYEQIRNLIQDTEFSVKGNFQVIQDFILLLKLAEFNLAELFSPYIGDIAAEGTSRCIQNTFFFFYKKIKHLRKYISETIIEEWRLAPGSLEVAWFIEKTKEVEKVVNLLAMHMEEAEGK